MTLKHLALRSQFRRTQVDEGVRLGLTTDERQKSYNGPYEAELILRRRPWKNVDDVERATLS